INLTPKAASRLFGGDIATWNDLELAGITGNTELKNCTAKVIRIVRLDSSGTTNILKQYLIRAEEERTGQACAPGKKWSAYFTTNTEWPGKQEPGKEGTCSEIKTPGGSGGKEVISLVKATEGAVGYSDLADSAEKGLLLPSVESALKT